MSGTYCCTVLSASRVGDPRSPALGAWLGSCGAGRPLAAGCCGQAVAVLRSHGAGPRPAHVQPMSKPRPAAATRAARHRVVASDAGRGPAAASPGRAGAPVPPASPSPPPCAAKVGQKLLRVGLEGRVID